VGDVFQFLVSDVVMLHMLGADQEYFPFISDVTIAMPDTDCVKDRLAAYSN